LFGTGGLAQPRRRCRPGQAEMVTQRLALVVAAQEATVLELRYDQVDKIGECAREIGRQYVVTVGGAPDEPLFKVSAIAVGVPQITQWPRAAAVRL
jgi:hypothetical protein